MSDKKLLAHTVFTETCTTSAFNTGLIGESSFCKGAQEKFSKKDLVRIIAVQIRTSEIPFHMYVDGDVNFLNEFLYGVARKLDEKGLFTNEEQLRNSFIDLLNEVSVTYMKEIRMVPKDNGESLAERLMEDVEIKGNNKEIFEATKIMIKYALLQGYKTMEDIINKIDAEYQIVLVDE